MTEEAEMWLAPFGIVENKFKYTDRRQEIGQEFEIVDTEAVEFVKTLIESGGRSLIHGDNGCGKSTALYSINPELVELDTSSFPIVIGPKSMMDLTSDLLKWEIKLSDEAWANLDGFHSPKLRSCIMPWTPPKSDAHSPSKYVCWYRGCRGISPRCDFPVFESGVTFQNVVKCLPSHINCRLAEWAIPLIFRRLGVNTFLFDVPDDVGGESSVRYFKDFMQELYEGTDDPTIILMATENQYKAMLKTEFFRRFDKYRFPPIKDDELKQIYNERLIESRGDSQIKYLNPLTDNALDYIILNTGHNPRKMLSSVKVILDKMKRNDCVEPVDVDYVQKAIQNVGDIVSDIELLQSVVNEFAATGVREVSAKEILKRMRDRDAGIRINEKNVGWMMRQLEYKRIRGRPTAWYKIR